jgi:hypothetical protein
MLAAANRRSISADDDLLFQKWFGISLIHGAVAQPKPGDPSTYAGGTLHYADGTPVAPPDPALKARVKANAARYCPALADQYATYFE